MTATVIAVGSYLTDQGRAPIEVARDGRMVEVQLGNGKIKRYWKGSSRSTFAISWEWLPSSNVNTIDGGDGRDAIRALFKDSQVLHTLTFNDEYGDSEIYTVWVEEYSETLKRRSQDDYFWDVTVNFKEQ